MNVLAFERAVWEIEGIRITIRAPRNSAINDYSYERQASSRTTVSAWRENRLSPLVNGYEVEIMDGSGNVPHGSILLANLRSTYA